MKSVGIIGAGACGLVVANLLKDGYKVTIFEKNDRIGKKILASGNGKCNFTNVNKIDNQYNCDFAYHLVNRFNNEVIRDYFSKLGLGYRVDSEGRVYPLSESSSSVVNALKKGLKKVRILLDSRVNIIESDSKGVNVYYNDKCESFDYLVCCSGSSASNLGSEYAYSYLRKYGLEFSEINPSLVPLKVKEDLKDLEGVRVKCLVSLLKDNKVVSKEKGEVLFRKDALSGIVIYNMSSVYNWLGKGKYKIVLDLTCGLENKNIKNISGLVHPKIEKYCNDKKIESIANLEFNVIGSYPKEMGQVISGGVSLKEINSDLSLKKDSRIFLGGEVIDCDGKCGGYNLQLAFSSAFMIAYSLTNNLID